MSDFPVVVAGGDLRQCYLAEFLHQNNIAVKCLKTPAFFHTSSILISDSLKDTLSTCQCFVGPMPLTRDGQHLMMTDISLAQIIHMLPEHTVFIGGYIPETYKQMALEKSMTVFDYGDCENLTLENAALTAEGILQMVLHQTPFALADSRVLITGAGRCGKAAAKIFKPLCLQTTLWNKSPKIISNYGEYDLIFGKAQLKKAITTHNIIINTVPARIFTREMFDLFSEDCYLFDLASAPGCIDGQTAASLPFFNCVCQGLPGKTAPKSAAQALGRSLMEHVFCNM